MLNSMRLKYRIIFLNTVEFVIKLSLFNFTNQNFPGTP